MKFPKRIKHKGQIAVIYGKSKSYPSYRLAWRVNGGRKLKAFGTYAEALAEGEQLVKDLAKGSQVTALTAALARDALAASQRLQTFYEVTGKRLSLLGAVSEYCESASKLVKPTELSPDGHSLAEATNGFLSSVATIKRINVHDVVEEFTVADTKKTKVTKDKAGKDQPPQLSVKFAYNRAIQLRRFAKSFPNTALCDLTKEHLDTFISSLESFSKKSRNHYRAIIRELLRWSVKKDYLSQKHRLLDATGMVTHKNVNTAEVEVYTPAEFRQLLEGADGSMRPMIAIGGLAGLRTSELLKLTWEEIWESPDPGHIYIPKGKSKTRQERNVRICPALAQWLKPFRKARGKLCNTHEVVWQQQFLALCEKVRVKRKANGLRHSFCSYHLLLHADEGLTAAQAGNSPAMIISHYRKPILKPKAKKWFDVRPTTATNVIQLPVPAAASA